MSTITLRRNWKVEGVLTDVTSMTLTNPEGTRGVVRNDTLVSVVDPGTAMTRVSIGTYEKSFTEPALGLTYTAYVRVVYAGLTYDFEVDVTGATGDIGGIATVAEVLADMGLSSPTAAETAVVTACLGRAAAAVRRYLGYDPAYRSRTEYYPRMDYNRGLAGQVWESEGGFAVLRQVQEASTAELQLQHLPIRSITSLRIDYDGRAGTKTGAFAAETEKTEGTDYWPNYDGVDDAGAKVCRDGIVRSMGLWPTTAGSVKVVYAAGYTAQEFRGESNTVDALPILETVVAEASRRARQVFLTAKKTGVGWVSGPLSSENLGDYSYSVDTGMAALVAAAGRDLTTDSKERLGPFRNMGLLYT